MSRFFPFFLLLLGGFFLPLYPTPFGIISSYYINRFRLRIFRLRLARGFLPARFVVEVDSGLGFLRILVIRLPRFALFFCLPVAPLILTISYSSYFNFGLPGLGLRGFFIPSNDLGLVIPSLNGIICLSLNGCLLFLLLRKIILEIFCFRLLWCALGISCSLYVP